MSVEDSLSASSSNRMSNGTGASADNGEVSASRTAGAASSESQASPEELEDLNNVVPLKVLK
ncbi:hypothetical protein [Mobilibacterium timonense]|uniref:hypothetical protein n=1 Tax=Mobilibacterium timonense TaxID=1871012 RepID=UPI000987BF49|nr:hypothetical protein [Mobilibacterium timonense]